MQHGSDSRSLGDLFSELSRETSTLVRQEVALAKAEISEKASKAGKNAGAIAVGGAVAYAGALAIIAALVILLGEILGNYWLSALIVGIIVAAVGYFLIQRGLEALKQIEPAPKQTIETLKEDREWLKEQTQ